MLGVSARLFIPGGGRDRLSIPRGGRDPAFHPRRGSGPGFPSQEKVGTGFSSQEGVGSRLSIPGGGRDRLFIPGGGRPPAGASQIGVGPRLAHPRRGSGRCPGEGIKGKGLPFDSITTLLHRPRCSIVPNRSESSPIAPSRHTTTGRVHTPTGSVDFHKTSRYCYVFLGISRYF